MRLARFVATLEELAASRERYRIARELHDTLAHTLSGMAIQLEAIDTLLGTARQGAGDAPALSASHQGRADGSPPGHSGAARHTARRSGPEPCLWRSLPNRGRIKRAMKLETDLPDESTGVPPEVEQAFYRIGQEAIENAARHSQARSVTVSLIPWSRSSIGNRRRRVWVRFPFGG